MRISGRISVVASAALFASAMASSSSALGFVAPVTAGPPKPTHVNHLDLNGFFPSATKIHVGDSVSFSINGFHTVTFLAAGQAPPALIIPSSANPVSGQFDAAKLPLWFNGQPNQVINPTAGFASGAKTYKGRGFLNSGTPAPEGPPTPFVVKFTKAGTFTFHCLVHQGMQGTVRVLPKGKHVQTAKQDRAAAGAQEAAAIRNASNLGQVNPPPATVLAGNDGSGSVAWLRFFPNNLTVKAGTTVEFKIASQREIHTVTIGPAAYTTAIENAFTTPHPNAGGPPTLVLNPFGVYPSDPPPLPPYTGTNHGNGFEGTGILAPGGPLPSSAKITFRKPGVYGFECIIHKNMDGTITVTK